MRIDRLRIALVITGFAVLVLGIPAFATTTRTYVSAFGDDSNNCTVSGPCRTFAQALTETSAGGEIVVLDSADYDAVTITQSVSILAEPGIYAGIHISSGSGVTVNGSGIKVVLRGLSIRGFGGSTDYGVYFQAGASLHVERCEISGMAGRAINMTASSGKLFVTDTVMRDGAGGPAVDVSATGASATFIRVHSLNNTGAGINLEAGSATIRDVVIANNGYYGIMVSASGTTTIERATVRNNYAGLAIGGSGVHVVVKDSTINRNGDGMAITNGATVIATGNTIIWNTGLGVYLNGGTLKSPGDNTIAENASGDVQGTLTSISKQ